MKIFLRISIVVVSVVLLIKILTVIFVEPWVGKKIQAALDENSKDYTVKIAKARILFYLPAIELKSIVIQSKQQTGVYKDVSGRIATIRIVGINFARALFKDDIYIRKIIISNSSIWGTIPFSQKENPPIIANSNIHVRNILIDKIDLDIKSSLSAKSFSLKEGVLNVIDLKISKHDTISQQCIKKFDCDINDFISVSSDSLYTYSALKIVYFASLNNLFIDSLSIHPNYKDYDFTSRHEYQTDRIEAAICNIYVRGFNAGEYTNSGSMVCSSLKIGKIDMTVFRDMRKPFLHVVKPTFPGMIYDYKGIIRIDSIGIQDGNITYIEHAKKANEPGKVRFNEIHAIAYKITNDTIYKHKQANLEIYADALLMGVSKLSVGLKARLLDIDNTISLTGYLSAMDANDLNPILEKNAFLYVTDGKIDGLKFDFTANNIQSAGKMSLLYHGLNIAIKNKQTNDTTAIKERVFSLIANIKVIDSNPYKNEKVREGIIEYKRDPERSLFNYYFKSILSGAKSSIIK